MTTVSLSDLENECEVKELEKSAYNQITVGEMIQVLLEYDSDRLVFVEQPTHNYWREIKAVGVYDVEEVIAETETNALVDVDDDPDFYNHTSSDRLRKAILIRGAGS